MHEEVVSLPGSDIIPSMGKGHVKIVLPCTNEGEWLRVTVDDILESVDVSSFEIFILLNGDRLTDLAFAREPRYRDRIRILEVKEPLGVGNSINRAVWPGDAEYYVFLDAHSLFVKRDWLQKSIACLEEHPEASMVQPEVVQFVYRGELDKGMPVERSRIQEMSLAYSCRWAWPYDHPWDIAEVQTRPLADRPYEAMAGGGMAVFVLAETFHRLGKYDSEVGGWYPECMDYCVRSWMLGHPMLVDPTVRVLHRIKQEGRRYPTRHLDVLHSIFRTAFKYLSPRRRDLAEILFRRHGLHRQVEEALQRVKRGTWLEERARHLRERVHDDDWLFSRFSIYEERFGVVSLS